MELIFMFQPRPQVRITPPKPKPPVPMIRVRARKPFFCGTRSFNLGDVGEIDSGSLSRFSRLVKVLASDPKPAPVESVPEAAPANVRRKDAPRSRGKSMPWDS